MRRSVWRLVVALIVAVGVSGGWAAQGQQGQSQEKPKQQPKEQPKEQPKDQSKDQEKEKEKDKAAAADPISGDWDGLVDMQEGPMAFSMSLKVEKDKVTGEIASQQGTTPIKEGTWADGTLTVSFVYSDGQPVTMSGSLKEDTLSGSLTYGGQMTLNWGAKRKVKQ